MSDARRDELGRLAAAYAMSVPDAPPVDLVKWATELQDELDDVHTARVHEDMAGARRFY